ncbi:GntR family transcriptional regulator [Amylibacter sp. SFDW26]|uniref:GntR family transcriptional regulator n=1 Tax=Amylibacter sp. SFDW26 TaxID=2652722 RepID=UPI0018698F23|nr:GntR family transcriptional regulator [Amylibacter sp. SFDW26]
MLSNSVLEGLRQEILSGFIPPGAVLLQSQIAKRFDVSRIPVRDALAILAVEKLVVTTPNNGARVVQLSIEELTEIYDLRITLETLCIAEAVGQASSTQMEDITYHLQLSNIEANRSGWAKSDWNFHKALYAPANKPHHVRIIHELRQLCHIHIKQYGDLCENTDHWLDQHGQIVKAFEGRDRETCCALIETHIRDARDLLIRAATDNDLA